MYDCNLVTAVNNSNYANAKDNHSYRITTQKEIFSILDKCHCNPGKEDAIFDFGCGKGGAIITFLDYGFHKVGGVEFEKELYEIMLLNLNRTGIMPDSDKPYEITCIHGDAGQCERELDDYNWFYYFDPFGKEIFSKTINNICESLKRRPRKIHIININPRYYDLIINSGCFKLTNQFCVSMRQKVVSIFVTEKKFEV